jgi:transketolase
VNQDRLAIATLRGLALDMPRAADSGHSGTAMALAPLGWLLYSRVLNHNPADPGWANRDRLIMSNGHACVLLYGLLHLCGYDLSLQDLRDFRKPGSRTPGHPESWVTPGIDFSTGPLGQGLAAAVGMAWAERLLAAHFGPQRVNHFTYVLCSDGDLMEGVSGEASSLAGHQRLSKLIVFYDDNRVTIDGPTSLSCSENVAGRYQAYGWQVLTVADGEDLPAMHAAILEAQSDERPTLIQIRTVIGYPAPTMQGRCEAHSPPFSPSEIRATKEVLGRDASLSFDIPAELASVARQLRQRGQAAQDDWNSRLTPEWHAWHQRKLPQEWTVPEFTQPVATRVASGMVLQSLARHLPNLVGGSADLAGSTNTRLPGGLDFGVREQAMAAICNGMAQHGGLIPFCSTYFAFSDQMKPSLRLAALAGLPVICIWTHDSLALGEDGPTHQPVEQLAGLRALPNFWVFRPADAHETAAAWQLAIAHSTGPVGLVLSRQTLPLLPALQQVWRGAYVVQDGPAGSPTLLATGSEVHLCLQAVGLLDFPVRVVSMPCWELFEQQPLDYQMDVLGSGPRLAVEAASWLGWHRWAQDVLSLDRFGASGPGGQLMALYGFTPEAVAARLRALACRPRI